MDLVPYIFHERQEPGSMLCAQHCLNNLLQQPMYTEFDLADLAKELDKAESAAAFRTPGSKSYHYDDTGFFGISVLERALQVWDLALVRWRGEAMRPFQDRPEVQAGFILNLESHWFALRRFGDRTRWYNLNSFLPEPEWISPTFLKMVLEQSEKEGYSVFVVRRAGAGEDGAEAGAGAGAGAGHAHALEVAEALGWEDGGTGILPESGADIMAVELGAVVGRSGGAGSAVGSAAASSSLAGPSYAGANPTPSEAAGAEGAGAGAGSGRRRRRQEDLVSGDMLAEDLAPSPLAGRSSRGTPDSARLYSHAAAAGMFAGGVHPDDDDELDDDEPSQSYAHLAPQDLLAAAGASGPTDFAYHTRSYDDEDEALQAALRASMEDLPPDFIMPDLAPLHPPPRPAAAVRADHDADYVPPPVPVPVPAAAPAAPVPDDELPEDDDDGPAEVLSPEEIRRARLARFQ